MVAIRSVVAATDLSAPARRAVDRAARVCATAIAPLTLVHAVNASALSELRRWLDTGEDIERSILDDVRARMHELATQIGARYRIDVDPQTVTGRAVDEITRLADDRHADLIVTGTLGTGLFRYHLVGSTAERVAKKSARPVLMVRQPARDAYRRVLVPVDFSRWAAPSIEIATAVAPDAHFLLVHCVNMPFEGRMHLVGVDGSVVDGYREDARDDARRRLAELASRAGLAHDRWTPLTPTRLDPWMAIVQAEQEQDCDLIVIGKHGRNVVEEFWLGSTTGMVIAEGASDVLVSTGADEA